MTIPNPPLAAKTDATRGGLRPSKQPPRPIPYPPEEQFGPIKGRR
jgi:hypothetical protein